MPNKYPLIPRSCQFNCIALSTAEAVRGADPALSIGHVACAWRKMESYVRHLVREAIRAFPPSAIGHTGEYDFRAIYCVRARLASNSDLVDDMVQEVACEFVAATKRGRVNAAVPALFGWAKVSTYRIVVRAAKPAILLAMGNGGPSSACSEYDQPVTDAVDTCQPMDTDHIVAATVDPAKILDCISMRPEILTKLTAARREVLVRWLRGDSPKEIAKTLGISRVAASLRLMHARKVLAA